VARARDQLSMWRRVSRGWERARQLDSSWPSALCAALAEVTAGWCARERVPGQGGSGIGGIQGWPGIGSRSAARTSAPCLPTVEMYPRIVYRCRVVSSFRSRPEIFCRVFAGRTSRSALCGYRHKADYAEFGVMRTRRWMPWHAGGPGLAKAA
jgi:hypothetical protein